MYRLNKIILSVVLLTTFNNNCWAAGYNLIERSASSLGVAFAGASTDSSDVSHISFNPALGVHVPNGISFSAFGIAPNVDFNNGNSSMLNSLGGVSPTSGGDGGDITEYALLPAIAINHKINDFYSLGLAIDSHYGLKTEYDNDWVGRYQAIKSDLKTVNIMPMLSVKASEHIALGLGINFVYAKATLSSISDYGTACYGAAMLGSIPGGVPTCVGLGLTPGNANGLSEMTGRDIAVGYTLGGNYKTEKISVGAVYRSRVHEHLEGYVNMHNVPAIFANRAYNGSIAADMTLPDEASISIIYKLSPATELLGDITWYNWSVFKQLSVTRTNGNLNGSILSEQQENWHDTVRSSIGIRHFINPKLNIKVGLAYDPSPVPENNVTARIPDNDRWWGSVGAGWRLDEHNNIDIGFTHIWVKDVNINQGTATSLVGNLNGSYNSDINIVGLQFTHNF